MAACAAAAFLGIASAAHAAPKDPGAATQATDAAKPSLSKKLNRTNGVIKPPKGIDPGIKAQAPVPYPNSTPVIPPPGARKNGGTPKIVPK